MSAKRAEKTSRCAAKAEAASEPQWPRGAAGALCRRLVSQNNSEVRAARTAPPPHEPEVAILSCSDARLEPEKLFGDGEGLIFNVRTAGNVLDGAAIESLKYAILKLRVKLVIVLGHTHCGAVETTYDCTGGTATCCEGFPYLCQYIEPSVVRDPARPRDVNVLKSIVRNITRSRDALQRIFPQVPTLGALYRLSSGRVTFLP